MIKSREGNEFGSLYRQSGGYDEQQQHGVPPFSNIYFKKLTDRMDSIMKTCQKINNLNNSPPYILDILPDIHSHMRLIINEHGGRFGRLNENDYFQTFVANLNEKCKTLFKIMRTAKGHLNNVNSAARRDLTRMSLIFSHMLAELKAIYPNGHYTGHNYKITKIKASEFWHNSFGPQMIVSWHSFKRELNRVQPLGNSLDDEQALQNTINLTQNDFISKFEFDIFTRLFQPWDQLLVNWKVLAVTHPGYASFMTYDEVKQTLAPFAVQPGSYLFRLSCTRLGQWAIGYVTENGDILQTIPQNKSLMRVLIDGDTNKFYTRPKGLDSNPDLRQYINETDPQAVEINEEEYQIYCDMGSTFQLCKICIENEKDTRIEPCMHLICSECLTQWQNKDTSQVPTCPFCRCDIKGFEKIKIQKTKKEEPLNPQQPAAPPKPPPPPTSTTGYLNTPSNEGGAVNMAFEPDPVNNSSQITPRSNYDPRLPPPIPPRVNNYDPNYDNATTTSY